MHTNKKIIHLITSLKVGGTELFLLKLVSHQITDNHVQVVYMKEQGLVYDKLTAQGIEVIKKSNIFSLYAHLLNTKPDILHTHLFKANVAGRIIGYLAGIKIIVSSQHSVDTWKSKWHWWMECISAVYASRIIANSQAAKNALISKGNIKESKILVSYIGIDTESITSAKINHNIIKIDQIRNKNVITYIGRLHYNKGSHFIPRIIIEFLKLNTDSIFLIAGSGKMENKINKMIHHTNIEKYVIMKKADLDIASILHYTTIFFMPSLEESFSNAALEAMACGKPVIITDVGGNAELVTHNKDGILVPPKDIKMMAQKIAELCSNEQLRKDIGEQARLKAGKFNIIDTMHSVDNVYEQLLKNRTASSE
ncbi:MAG: glycosyltransferase [bacterium]